MGFINDKTQCWNTGLSHTKESRMVTTFNISLLGSLAQANFVWSGDINIVMSGGGVDWPWICILVAIVSIAWVLTSRKR